MPHKTCSEFLDCIVTHLNMADSVLPFRFNLDIQYSEMHYSETVNDIEIKHIHFNTTFRMVGGLDLHFQRIKLFLCMKYFVT
jgi:hypothetical protein